MSKSLHFKIEKASHASAEAKLVKLADKFSNLSGLLHDPPSLWSRETIIGYAKWCFVVCNQLYGLNEGLDKLVKNVFEEFEISSVTNDELLNYYDNIKETE
jgi:hypothetical protein